ncbi:MAG: hypothetical protein KGO96_07590 [Elusimicrobia bacterium]|nr:hypothetical protein [Elusimicrobiota bacterium]
MINKVLKSIVSEYFEHKKIVERDLTGWDKMTINGQLTAQRVSGDRMNALRNEYARALRQNSVFILTYGTAHRSEFLKLVDSDKYLVFNTDALYYKLSDPIDASLDRKREFNSHSVMLLIGEMARLGKELDLEYVTEPKIKSIEACKDRDEVFKLVRKLVKESSSETLQLAYLENQIISKSLSDKRTEDLNQVVIMCSDKEEADALSKSISNNYVVLDLDSETEIFDARLTNKITKQFTKTVSQKG